MTAARPSRRRLLQAAALGLGGSMGLGHAARAAATGPRIVAVGGAITETVYALGAAGTLVGVDTTSLYPDAARALPSVGYARALSAEGVLSLAPTAVIASDEAGPPAVLRQLRAARVPVHVLPAEHRIEGLARRTRAVAALLGRAEAGEALAAQWQREAEAARAEAQRLAGGRPPPRVLFVLAHAMNAVRVAGRDTAADAMLTLAGARNALAGVAGYVPLNAEAALAAAPEVLLVTDQGLQAAGGIDGLLRAPGLAATPAGRARRVLSLDALWLLGFGPRLPSAIRTLGQGLHGTGAAT